MSSAKSLTGELASPAQTAPVLADSNRVQQIDKKFDADVSDREFANQMFVRLVAKGRRFTKVDFKYSIFDNCYLRDCTFDSCDFVGSRFIGTNLHGSRFSGCKFDYAIFEKTTIDSEVLDTECPGPENIKMRFARTLRMNYQQLGDAKAANKSIGVELQATGLHLYKAWRSNESYYRKKYAGWRRVSTFFEWTGFKILDFIWGNGESAIKLLRATLLVFLVMCLIDANAFRDPHSVDSYIQALAKAPQVFLGTLSPTYYPSWYLTVILFVRLLAFGFFMSIIIKRLNRR